MMNDARVTMKKNKFSFKNTKHMVALALLIALSVVLKRFLGINMQLVSISFGFLPIALSGALFGVYAGLFAGAMADLIGAILFPFGAFNPVFTVLAGLSGLIYGLFLSSEKVSLIRIILCQLIISAVIHVGLNTTVIALMYNKAFLGILNARIFKNFAMLPLEVASIYLLINLRPVILKSLK